MNEVGVGRSLVLMGQVQKVEKRNSEGDDKMVPIETAFAELEVKAKEMKDLKVKLASEELENLKVERPHQVNQ